MNKTRIAFELHKVLREIKIHGEQYVIYRDKLDKYGEPVKDEKEQIVEVKGLFHTVKGYVTKNVKDGTTTHGKGYPKILVAYTDVENIMNGDYTIINGKKYIVVDKNDMQNYNIVSDISLEVVLDGNKS